LPQDLGIAAVHFPPPSQVAELVSVPLAQIWALHTVDGSQSAHFPVPSQVPLNPQVVLAVGVHRPPGSVPPSGTGVHVPSCPGKLQLMQVPVPSELHRVLQQYPSAQAPLRHWASEMHRAPFWACPQVPFGRHTLFIVQSKLEVHLLLQSPVAASHAYTPHDTEICIGHARPLPPQ